MTSKLASKANLTSSIPLKVGHRASVHTPRPVGVAKGWFSAWAIWAVMYPNACTCPFLVQDRAGIGREGEMQESATSSLCRHFLAPTSEVGITKHCHLYEGVFTKVHSHLLG